MEPKKPKKKESKISVATETKVTIKIKGKIHILTLDEADLLYDALGDAIEDVQDHSISF